MWTKMHRARHDVRLKGMVSTYAVAEIARWLERADPPRSKRRTPLLPVVGAIAWHLRAGGAWRALPAGWPPWRTVYGWFRRWLERGLFDRLMRAVACLRRRAEGADPSRAWPSSTPSPSSAFPCAARAALTLPRRCSGASALPWWTQTALGWPWRLCPRTYRTATAWRRWPRASRPGQACARGVWWGAFLREGARVGAN